MKDPVFVLSAIVMVLVAGLILMFLFSICPPSGPWPMPPWCEQTKLAKKKIPETEKPEFPIQKKETSEAKDHVTQKKPASTKKFFLEDPMNFIRRPFLGISWLREWNNYLMFDLMAVSWWVIWFVHGSVDKSTLPMLKWYRDHNIHVIGAMLAAPRQYDTNPIMQKDWACKDIYGNPIYIDNGNQYWMNLLHPEWQEFLVSLGKQLVDLGIEGITFDEFSFNKFVINKGGTFDEYSMRGFKEYLAKKYSVSELKNKFGINKISDFNFKDYIIKNHLEKSWNKLPYPDITKEFYRFQTLASSKVMKKIIKEIKNYAQEKYNRKVVISANITLEFSGNLLDPSELDYLTVEQFYFGSGGSNQKVILSKKLAEGIAPSTVSGLSEVSLDYGQIPRNTKNLFKYIFADFYSSDARLTIAGKSLMTMHKGNYLSDKNSVKLNLKEAAKYANFAAENEHLFGLKEPAEIAVVNSIASRMGGAQLISVENREIWSEMSIKGVMEMLLNLNVPFHMLVSSDNEICNKNLTLEDLSRYKIIIMPAVFMLDPKEEEAIYNYINKGGIVIVINKFATHNKNGKKVNSKYFNNLKDGETKIGKGKIYYIAENIGEKYFYDANGRVYLPSTRKKNNKYLQKFKKVLFKYYNPKIKTNAPPTINIRQFTNGNEIVLHIVNYNYDQTKDKFEIFKNMNIELYSTKSVESVKLYDFESQTVQKLNFSYKNNWVSFTIPSIFAYCIVEIKTNP